MMLPHHVPAAMMLPHHVPVAMMLPHHVPVAMMLPHHVPVAMMYLRLELPVKLQTHVQQRAFDTKMKHQNAHRVVIQSSARPHHDPVAMMLPHHDPVAMMRWHHVPAAMMRRRLELPVKLQTHVQQRAFDTKMKHQSAHRAQRVMMCMRQNLDCRAKKLTEISKITQLARCLRTPQRLHSIQHQVAGPNLAFPQNYWAH
jgi:hypothetical protein